MLCSIHVTPTDPYQLIRSITIAVGELTSKVINGGNALVVQRAEEQLEHAKTLLKNLIRSSSRFLFYMCADDIG